MTQREIGSEFWNAETGKNHHCIKNTYLSGRAALTAIIIDLKRRGIRKVGLPDYCCDSMIEPFLRQGMDISFYPIGEKDGKLTFSLEQTDGCEAVLLVDFFGFMHSEIQVSIQKCKESGKSIILDLTQAVFSDYEYSADYIFGSYRKWTGIEFGFSVSSRQNQLDSWKLNDFGSKYLKLRNEARNIKSEFVAGDYSNEDLRQKQLSLFNEAEDILDKEYLSDTDEYNKKLFKSLNIDFIKKKRKKNAETIYANFSKLKFCKPIFTKLSEDGIPLAVPILVTDEKRDSLRTFLREHGVFCPVHWSLTAMHKAGEKALTLYKNELSLVCDQRYDESDMLRMMEIINQWEKQ